MARSIASGAKALRNLGADPGAMEIVDELAQIWVETSRDRVPVDTGQTQARTMVSQVSGSGRSATAWVEADTPYAGFVEYGTRYVPPRPFFRQGRDEAARVAGQLGGPLQTELRRGLSSGGAWNPRALF